MTSTSRHFRPLSPSKDSTQSWKPYPAYKPSGVEWLGDVPESWTSVTLRRIARRYAGGTPDRSNDSYWAEGTIPWVNSGAVNQGIIIEPSAFITEDGYRNSSAKWVAKGDLVMALAGQGKTKGMVAQMGIAATCNQSMAAISPNEATSPRYLYWLLVSQYEHIRNMAGGEQRDGLNLDILGSIPCLQFDPAKQVAIADFLDRETGKIDRLVAKKRELIEKLKEERTALISRAVTRGLNPDAKLKPSGVGWLGELPQGWDAIPLKWRARTRSGDGIATEDVQADASADNPIPVIGGNGLMGYCAENNVRNPVIVIGRVGALCGNVHQVTSPAWITDNALILTADPKAFDLSYLAAVLRMRNLNELADKTAQPLITGTRVRAVTVPKPPLPEQRAIADFLDRETGKIDRLVVKVEEAIGRLQKYRAALITAAVTGKIDVSAALNAGVQTAADGAALEYPAAESALLKAAESADRAYFSG